MFDIFGFYAVVVMLVIAAIILGIGYLVKRSAKTKLEPLFWKKLALGIAIAITIPMMTIFGARTFIDMPDRDQYINIELSDYMAEQRYKTAEIRDFEYTAKRAEYDRKFAEYSNALTFARDMRFASVVILGAVALGIGLFWVIPVAGTGLMWGGSLSMFIAYTDYWAYLSNMAIFITAVLVFAGLIFVAWKKFGGQNVENVDSL